MNEQNVILEKIQIEEYIWIIYLIIIGLSFYANSLEKKYYKYSDIESKEKYRQFTILIFLIALIVYIYFFNDNYNEVKNLKLSDSYDRKFFNNANLAASTLILIAGTIFLFIAIYDVNLDTEIAFS